MGEIGRINNIINKFKASLKQTDKYTRIHYGGLDGRGISLQNQEYLRAQHSLDDNSKILLWIDNDHIEGSEPPTDSSGIIDAFMKGWDLGGYKGSFVLTDKQICVHTTKGPDDDEQRLSILFGAIEGAEYRDQELVLYADAKKETIGFRCPSKYVSRCSEEVCPIISELVSQISEAVENKPDELMRDILASYQAKDYDKCISLCDKMPPEYPGQLVVSKIFKAIALIDSNGDQVAARFLLDQAAEILSVNTLELDKDALANWCAVVEHQYGKLNHSNKDYLEALYNSKRAISIASGRATLDEDLGEYKRQYATSYACFLEEFSSYPYDKRKVICVVDDLPLERPKTFIPLTKEEAGKLIKFPPGHPVANELYVGHPHEPNRYYPIETYEDHLFQSQVMELNHILQSLGAAKIIEDRSVTSTEKTGEVKKSEKLASRQEESKVNAGLGIHSGSAGHKGESTNQDTSSSESGIQQESGRRMATSQTFEPKFQPFIPTNLSWYNYNPTWQSLAKQRLQGELLSSEILISTKQVEVVSAKQLSDIQADHNRMICGEYSNPMAKIGGANKSTTKSSEKREHHITLEKRANSDWRIYVEFIPMPQLAQLPRHHGMSQVNSTPDCSENEAKYVELLKDTLENGVIPDGARKILIKSQQRFAISSERAAALERVVTQNIPRLTTQEQDYMDLVVDVMDNREITPEGQKILEKRRLKAGLSIERAKEIERYARLEK